MTIKPIEPFINDAGERMYVVYCATWQSASLRVMEEFHGRNWRRIKRELRKEYERCTKQCRST